MDKIWDRSRRSLAVVAAMKKPNDHAEPTKVERIKKREKSFQKSLYKMTTHVRLMVVYSVPRYKTYTYDY